MTHRRVAKGLSGSFLPRRNCASESSRSQGPPVCTFQHRSSTKTPLPFTPHEPQNSLTLPRSTHLRICSIEIDDRNSHGIKVSPKTTERSSAVLRNPKIQSPSHLF